MPQAVKTDRFDRRAYNEALQHSPDMQDLQNEGLALTDDWESLQNDTFQECYQFDPTLDPPNALNRLNHRIMQNVEQTEEYQELRTLTINDSFNSTVATNILGHKIMPEVSEELAKDMQRRKNLADQKAMVETAVENLLKRKAKADQQQAQNQQPEEDPNKLAQEIADVQADLTDILLAVQDIEDEDAADPAKHEPEIEAIRRAFREGSDEAVEMLLFVSTAGDGIGVNTGSMSLEEKQALADKLTNSKKLQKIFAEAGRIKKIVGAKQPDIIPERREEKVGIKTGNTPVHDILPRELALAGHPAAKVLFAKRYVERGLMMHKWQGRQEMGAGPILIVRDDSGSTRGAIEVWEKAVTLAFMNLANRDKRDVYLMAFSHSPSDAKTWLLPYRSKPDLVTWDVVLDVLTTFIDGGTDFEYPFTWCVDRIDASVKPGAHPLDKPWEKADVIMLTDGACGISPTWEKWFLEKKQDLGFHTFAVLFGTKAPSLTNIVENLITISNLANAKEEDAALTTLFTHTGGH